MKKRLCLFAGYNKNAEVKDYVFYYLNEISKFADIAYCSDGNIDAESKQKIDGLSILSINEKHGRYDFGSWQKLIIALGWEKINEYDELLLVNDSCYAPLFPLKNIFDMMENENLDAWGICKSGFIMSFFVCIKKKIYESEEFKRFFSDITKEQTKSEIILKYEIGLSNIIIKYRYDTWIGKDKLIKLYRENSAEIKNKIKNIIPWYHRIFIRNTNRKIRMYTDEFINLFLLEFPLVKRNILRQKNTLFSVYYADFIKQYTNYPLDLIEKDLESEKVCVSSALYVIIKKIVNFISKFIYEKTYKNGALIIKILKITIYKKSMF